MPTTTNFGWTYPDVGDCDWGATLNSLFIAVDDDLYTGAGSGTSFPGSPAAGQRFFRTDLGWLCYYDGTRWLTAHEYNGHVIATAFTANGASTAEALRGDYAPYITRVAAKTYVVTTNDGSNYWTCTVRFSAGGTTTLLSFNTSGDAPNAWVDHGGATLDATPANYGMVDATATKTLAPGTLIISADVQFRLIVT